MDIRIYQNKIAVFFFVIVSLGYAKSTEVYHYSSLLDTSIVQNSYTIDNIDFILGNVDLRSYHFKYEKEGFYQKVVRVSFMQNLVPITIEIGLTGDETYDLLIKYGEGDTIKFNNYPYVASEKKKLLFKNIKGNEQIQYAKEIFQIASNLSPVKSLPASCPFHILEYRDDSENGNNYYKYYMWCQISEKKQLALITDLYLLTSSILQDNKKELLFLAQWEDLIIRWNSGKVKRFLTK